MTHRLLILALVVCCTLPCLGKPGDRLKGKRGPDILKLIGEASLRVSRLFVASSAADLPLAIQELDASAQRLETVKQQLQASHPDWKKPEVEKVFTDIERVLDFARFQVEVRLGSAGNMEARVDDFLTIPQLTTGQRMGLLTSASLASYRRGQLTVAQRLVKKAEQLAATGEVSPVALFNLRTTSFLTRGFETPALEDLRTGFRHAWEPLEGYQTKENPFHDGDWLFAREASRYWVEEFSRVGPEGTPQLLVIYRKATEMNDRRPVKWNKNRLKTEFQLGFPFADFITSMADTTVLAAAVDQIMSVSEALPAEEFVKNDCRKTIDKTNQEIRTLVPELASKLCNAEYPTLTTFELGQGGLLQELKGRGFFLDARFADESQKPRLLDEGLSSISRCDNKLVEVQYLFKAAQLFEELGQPAKAEAAWLRALEIATDADLTIEILDAREKLAKHYLKEENWENAKEHAQKGIDTIKQALPFVGTDSQASKEFANRSHSLSAVVAQASLATDDTSTALAALNMGGEVGAAASQMSSNAAEFEEVKQKKKKVVLLTEQVETLKEMPPSATRDELLQENEKLLADTKAEFLSESRKIREENSALYSSVLRFDPLDLPDVQGVIPPNATVIQYFPTDTSLYIFVVSKDSFVLRSVDVSSRAIDDKIVTLLRNVTRPGMNPQEMDTARRELYNILIAPVEEDIDQKDTLVLIPAGRLNFLPFGILLDSEGNALLDQKLLLELAKPTDFLRISSTTAQPIQSVVAYANATLDLPAAATEGEAVTGLFEGSKLFKGDEASKDNFFAHGGTKDVLHLATHGQWDMANALNSHLKLANGQNISQQDIFEMDLGNTSLVTLSACNTAVSQRHDVDFVASLAEAFWIAGSRSVVATLWSVDDDSTGLLMSEFYKGLKSGQAKSESLRKAQLAVKSDPRFEHPYYWGGVMLFGDWR
jgi:CHAT domain-containing protein